MSSISGAATTSRKEPPSSTTERKSPSTTCSSAKKPKHHHDIDYISDHNSSQLRSEPPFTLLSSASSSSAESPPTFQQAFNAVVQLLRNKKRIVILTGAGMSVSCGIPDFRTKGSGLYSTLDTAALGLSYPEELFDAYFFRENPAPFYKFASRLYFPFGTTTAKDDTIHAIRAKPSDSHRLLGKLEEKKMLLRVYTQNIDGLEEEAGVTSKKICYAHGSLHWATCCKCKRKVNTKEIESNIMNGTVPHCQAPVLVTSSSSGVTTNNSSILVLQREPSARVALRKRSRSMNDSVTSDDDEYLYNEENDIDRTIGTNGEKICGGIMKPGITFFGEALHNTVKSKLESDRDKVDALIVIGTSLSVAPISKVIDYLPKNIPRILINRTIVHPPESIDDDCTTTDDEKQYNFRNNYVFDAYLLGYCDVVTRALEHALFHVDSTGSDTNATITADNLLDGSELLSTLLGSSENSSLFNADDWKGVSVPSERVLLFPGAQAPQNTNQASSSPMSGRTTTVDSDMLFREIAHCDGCTKRIEGTIQKCTICFDYDLCKDCFPLLSKTHSNGKHKFAPEAVAFK